MVEIKITIDLTPRLHELGENILGYLSGRTRTEAPQITAGAPDAAAGTTDRPAPAAPAETPSEAPAATTDTAPSAAQQPEAPKAPAPAKDGSSARRAMDEARVRLLGTCDKSEYVDAEGADEAARNRTWLELNQAFVALARAIGDKKPSELQGDKAAEFIAACARISHGAEEGRFVVTDLQPRSEPWQPNTPC